MLPALNRNNFLRNGDVVSSWLDDIDHGFSQFWRKMVDDVFKPHNLGDLKNKIANSTYPRGDEYTTADHYCIDATVPGARPDDVSVELMQEGDTRYVKISGTRTQDESKEGANYRLREIRSSRFIRTIPLPDDLIGDPEAALSDGILSLRWAVPKKQSDTKSEVRSIPIKKS